MTKPEINVTPLIDVLLVLLIIFMVVTPMKPTALDAKIPQPPADDPQVYPPPLALVVVINPDTSLRLNTEHLQASAGEPAELIERLQTIFQQRTQNVAFAESKSGASTPQIEKTVFIKAPRGLDYGSVAKVIDSVKIAGASPVSLQIDGLD